MKDNNYSYDKRLRVCNVDEEGRFGGPERRIVQVAQALSLHGVDTHVLYPELDSVEFTKQLNLHGIKTTKMNITRLSKHWKTLIRYILRFPVEVFKLAWFFRKNSFDLIHVNGSYQFKVALSGNLANTPVIWHLNDTYTPGPVKAVFDFIANKSAAGFIVAGQRVREYYLSQLNINNKPISEIHAPVVLSDFDPNRFPSSSVDGIDNDVRIGTVSGVNPAKGLECFVEMAATIIQLYPAQRFIVAGARLDSQREYASKLDKKIDELGIRDNIDFVGFVDDVPMFLSELDICVFTSVTEASPTSIWEALAMAKPVVTTDVGAVSQYIVNDVSGFIVPVADAVSLANNVLKLIDNPVLCKEIGAEARCVAVSKLGVEAAALKHKEIYHRTMQAFS